MLVNNAVYQGPATMDRFLDIPLDLAERIVEGTYLHQLSLVQKVLPSMLAQDPWDDAGTLWRDRESHVRHRLRRSSCAGRRRWVGACVRRGQSSVLEDGRHPPRGVPVPGDPRHNVDPGHIVTENMRALSGQAGDRPEGITNTSPEIPGAVVGWLASDDDDAVVLAGQLVKAHRVCKERALVPGWPLPTS